MKKLEKYWKRLFSKFCFSLITFCAILEAMKEDLLLAILFAFLPGMLIGKDKSERVVKDSRKCSYSGDKGNYTVRDDDTAALLYDGKQVCADLIVEVYVKY